MGRYRRDHSTAQDEEGFRSESAETRGAARLAVRSARSGGASCLKKAAAYFAKGVQK